MDAYISRCLKNWAVQRQPASDGRQRLLRAATIRPDIYRTRLGLPVSSMLRSLFSAHSLIEPEADWLFIPFTQSRLWSFHLATSPHITI